MKINQEDSKEQNSESSNQIHKKMIANSLIKSYVAQSLKFGLVNKIQVNKI